MILSPRQEGGCPFKHFDNENLLALVSNHMDKNSNDNIDNILIYRKENPSYACKVFLEICNKKLIKNPISMECSNSSNTSDCIKFNNPVQYFLLRKSNV